MKVLREAAIKDPFEKVDRDVHDLIFQHLFKADILKISEVSPKWNFMISNSSVAMSKVSLRLTKGAFVSDEALKSQRHYNNLELVISDDAFFEIHRKLQFIIKISPWLKHLEIGVFAKFVDLQALPLPQLEISNIFSPCMPFIFTKVNTLKKLTIDTPFYNREAVEWIQKQSELKELKLQGFNNFFHFDPVAPKGVEKLTLLGNWNGAIFKLNNFLMSISDSLTFLSLSYCFPSNLELIVNGMPKLKIFACGELLGNINNLKLKPNKNITVLNLNYLLRSLITLQALTGVLKVEEIFSYEWISQNMINLKFARMHFHSH
jgi:hypothetical protein